MRSLATRDAGSEISQALPDVIAACKVAGFDLVIVETSGIGQGDAAIVPHVDVVDVRDDAGIRRRLAARKNRHARFRRLHRHQQVRPQGRARRAARRAPSSTSATANCGASSPDEMPVFGTQASRFNDDGVTALYQGLLPKLARTRPADRCQASLPAPALRYSSGKNVIVPPARSALPGRNRRHRARLPPPRGTPGQAGARAPAAARIEAHAAGRRPGRSHG